MRELDLILKTFVISHYRELNQKEKSSFESLLDLQDPVLYDWFLGNVIPTEPHYRSIVERIRNVVNS